MLHRRRLLTGLIAAPLVVAAGSLMPLRGVVTNAADLVLHPFTLSWWERVSAQPGVWRQNFRRFMAYGVAPSVEVNPSIDTNCVAGVQLDSSGAWIGDRYLPPASVKGVTWREGPKAFALLRSRWDGIAEIELSPHEERALIAHRGGEVRPRFGVLA